jgi:NADH-quinone oxidoreductase subunit H
MADDFLVTEALADLLAPYIGATAALLVSYGLIAFILVNFVMVVGGLMSYVMRKVMARIQTRLGPNRVGPFGLLQFLADGVKMISKEEFRPAAADKWGYRIAPYLAVVPMIVAFAALPFGQGVILADLRVGLLFILAIGAITPVGEVIAGWASNNKYSTLGALRAASLDISYEIPMILAAVSVIILTGSISLQEMIEAQRAGVWFVLLQPLGAFIFFATALAKAGIVPTDLGESESELIAGYFTEYGGMRFGVFQIVTFVNVVFISMLTIVLYFGGWALPFVGDIVVLGLDITPWVGVLVFLLKTAIFTLFTLTVWFTLPRFRPDQFLSLGWKVLFPLSLVNLVVTAIAVYYLGGA